MSKLIYILALKIPYSTFHKCIGGKNICSTTVIPAECSGIKSIAEQRNDTHILNIGALSFNLFSTSKFLRMIFLENPGGKVLKNLTEKGVLVNPIKFHTWSKKYI